MVYMYVGVMLLVGVAAIISGAHADVRGGGGGGGEKSALVPHHVMSTLSPTEDAPGALQVSFATQRLDPNAETKPSSSGVLYWLAPSSQREGREGDGGNGDTPTNPGFAPADVTAYNHSGYDKFDDTNFGFYASEWQHHALIIDEEATKPGMTLNYRPVRDMNNATTYGDVFTVTIPPLASAFGGDAEQRTVLGLIGDLGQTTNSEQTMAHLSSHVDAAAVLLVGDLSYADCEQTRWDSWREFVETDFARVPLLTLPGNHEVEEDTHGDMVSFKPYASRFRMAPTCDACAAGSYAYDGWKANMWFSVSVGSATIITLSSYHNYSATSAQYAWLEATLKAVDRVKSPWLIVSMHAPWYNSNVQHQGEAESVGMRAAMEDLLHEYAVDIVFAGHVHAYERMHPTYKNETDESGPTFINIGDGGNREGLYDEWLPGKHGQSKPSWSAKRKGSYGHGILTLDNSRTATWVWHRNEDADFTIGDAYTLTNKVHGRSLSPSSRHVLLIAMIVVAAIVVVIASVVVRRSIIQATETKTGDMQPLVRS